MKRIVFVLAGLASQLAFGYNVSGLVGAWAFADDTNKTAVVVIEHHVAWLHRGGEWVSCGMTESRSDLDRAGVILTSSDEEKDTVCVIETVDAEMTGPLEALGLKAAPGLVVLGSRTHSDEYRKARVMAKTTMPDWEAACPTERFFGAWSADEDGRFSLVVRPGGTAVIVPTQGPAADVDGRETSVGLTWMRDCAGIRFFLPEDSSGVGIDGALCKTMRLRPDGKSAELVGLGRRRFVVTRSAAQVEDPVDRRRKMAKENAYHGMWVLNDKRDGYSFYISPKGRGILVGMKFGPENILPFNWKGDTNGVVRCTIDLEFAKDTPYWFSEFAFRYHPETNVIELILPPDAKSGGKNPEHKELAFYNWNEMVDEVIETVRKERARKIK
jgi:hypothetical protein